MIGSTRDYIGRRNRGRRMMLLGKPFQEFVDSIPDFDWLHLQELIGSVALATNSSLQFGKTIGLDINPMIAGANWAEDANWNIAAGVATHTPGAADDLTQAGILETSKDYRTIVVITNRTVGNITINYGTAPGATRSTNDTFTEIVTSNGADLVVEASNGFDGDINFTEIQQTDIAASSDFPGTELLSAAGTGVMDKDNYDVGSNAALTNPSVGILRITRNGSNNPFAFQNVLTDGVRFRLSGEARSGGGTAQPRYLLGFTGPFVEGTTSTDLQTVFLEDSAVGIEATIQSLTSIGTEYTEWRNISIRKANPMNLTNTGMAIGQPGAGNVPYIYLGDGATTGLVYDTIAEWNSKLNPDKLTMAVVVRVDDWGVGTGVIWRLAVDGNTEIVLERRASELAWRYNVEGNFDEVTFDTATLPGGSPSEPFTMVMTVDTDGAGEIIGYMKGIARGTSTITGSWVGNLDPAECAVFAADNAQLNSLDGGGAHIGLGYRVMTPFEVVEFNTRSGL